MRWTKYVKPVILQVALPLIGYTLLLVYFYDYAYAFGRFSAGNLSNTSFNITSLNKDQKDGYMVCRRLPIPVFPNNLYYDEGLCVN